MRKLSVLALSIMLILCLMPTSALAWDSYNDHVLIYGIGDYGNSNQCYWTDSSASAYSTIINTAMDEWIYTTGFWGISTPISYVPTSVQSSSRMDIYKVSTVNSWWGMTQLFWGGQVDPNNSNWVWGKIHLDGDFNNLSGSDSNNRRKAVIAHEMGHVMGLDHFDANVLMNAEIAGMSQGIFRAQPNDLYGINHVYLGTE